MIPNLAAIPIMNCEPADGRLLEQPTFSRLPSFLSYTSLYSINAVDGEVHRGKNSKFYSALSLQGFKHARNFCGSP